MIQADKAKTQLITQALPHIAAHGWTMLALTSTEKAEGIAPGTYAATFPEGMQQFIREFQDWLNAEMTARIGADKNFSAMKVREKIFTLCMTRYDILAPHRDTVKRLVAHQLMPWNGVHGAADLGRAADAMWKLAGDRSIDYNFYTKRFLLAGVYASTLQVWLDDESKDNAKTQQFLKARIENVLKIGKAIGGLKDKFKGAA